jgi:hypothetical protein
MADNSLIGQVASAIAQVVRGVTDAGVVYSYQPMPRAGDWAAFVDSFSTALDGKAARHVRCWTVQYLGEQRIERSVAQGQSRQRREMRWVVRGHMSWDGSSEPTFRALVEAVADALDAARSLGGLVIDHDPVDIDFPGNGAGVVLGDVLCHLAEITMTAYAEATVATT